MPKILVTGAQGFAANAVCTLFESAGHTVERLGRAQGDVANYETFNRLKGDYRAVVHMAARTFVPESWEKPGEYFRANVQGTNCVLDFCRERGVPLCHISSYIYGPPEYLPVREDAPIRANNPYMRSKQMAEELCEFYAQHYEMDVCILRPFNLYGPNQKGHFLIAQILSDMLTGREIRVKDLAPRRDYLYVNDFARAVLSTLDKKGYLVYNVGAGCSYSVEEIIDCAQRVLKTSLPVVEIGAKRRGELPNVFADIRKISDELGWKPSVSLEQGLALTADALRSI